MKFNNKKIIEGTFIQPGLIADWSAASFDEHFRSYKEIGFDHVIIQWTEYFDTETGIWYTYYPSDLSNRKLKVDLMTNMLESGKKNNMKVYVGLGTNNEWWSYIKQSPSVFDEWFKQQTDESIKLIQDFWGKYTANGSEGAIAGWYIVFEADNLNFNAPEKQNILAKNYARVSDYAHELTGLPVVISPFFNRALGRPYGPRQWGKALENILRQSNIDILAMQDGIGCNREPIDNVDEERKKAIKEVPLWYKAAKKSVKKCGKPIEFWTNVETFTETIVDGKSNFDSASIDRIVKQIDAEKSFVSKITSFSFQAYQDYDVNKELFNEYKDYVVNPHP